MNMIKSNISTIKFSKPFMGFVADQHSFQQLEQAVVDLFDERTVMHKPQFDAIDFLEQSQKTSDILLLDLSQEKNIRTAAENLIAKIDDQTDLIILGAENEINLYRDLLSMGVSDYLVKPISHNELHNAIKLIKARKKDTSLKKKADEHKLVTILGASSGVGTSNLADNLAWYLSEEKNIKTGLLDMDPHYGVASLSLDIQPSMGLREAYKKPERMDDLIINNAMMKTHKNLYVLATEESTDEEIQIAPMAAEKMIDYCERNFQITVLDCPRQAVRLYKKIFEKSDKVYVVTELSLNGLRDSIRVKKLADDHAKQNDVFFLVGRHDDKCEQISKDEFEKNLGQKISYFVPCDYPSVKKASSAGEVLAKSSPQSPVMQVVRSVANEIMAEVDVPNTAPKSFWQKLWGDA